MIKKNLSSFLSENIKPVKAMAGMAGLQLALSKGDQESLARANAVLDHFKNTLDAEVCYLMDPRGLTIASSNRQAPDSFVGQNFGFRPYFQQAIARKPATYLALGTTSGRHGAYYSHPVYDEQGRRPLGVAVIKSSIDNIEELVASDDEWVFVIDSQGVVFVSNRPEWLYHTLSGLSPEQSARIAATLQFGAGPWKWTGLTLTDENTATDRTGSKYLVGQVALEPYPGWKVVQLRGPRTVAKIFADPLLKLTGYSIIFLCMLVGVSAGLLYWRASNDLVRRKTAEQALKTSEERYRSIYNRAPGYAPFH